MNWQAKKEDFKNGWIEKMLAESYPFRLEARLNIFTNEVMYTVLDSRTKLSIHSDRNFDRALKIFNEKVAS